MTEKIDMAKALKALDESKRLLANAKTPGDIADYTKLVEMKQARVDAGGTVASTIKGDGLPIGENPYDSQFSDGVGGGR